MSKPQAILLAVGCAALAAMWVGVHFRYWPPVVIGGLLWIDLVMMKAKE